jgi:transcriptional/translational regulatory protein YebC/TACO1
MAVGRRSKSEANSRLRAVIQNSKAANMKDNVERAIKKNYKDTANYKSFV